MRPNPIKLARKNLGLTQADLAQRCQITRQVVVLAEQGLFLAPPRSIVGDNDKLRIEYYAWVVAQRHANRPMFEHLDVGTWKELRLHFGSLGNLCRAMVYQRSVLSDFEKNGWGATNICVALRQCGLGEESVERIFG